MTNETAQGAMHVKRTYEQPPDAISVYSDFAQVIGTENEVVLQFYESIPGTPGPRGQVETVRTRLRATIIVSPAHASNIGRLLTQQAGTIKPEAKTGEGH